MADSRVQLAADAAGTQAERTQATERLNTAVAAIRDEGDRRSVAEALVALYAVEHEMWALVGKATEVVDDGAAAIHAAGVAVVMAYLETGDVDEAADLGIAMAKLGDLLGVGPNS